MENKTPEYKRHWSFIVCDPKYLYSIVVILIVLGFMLTIILDDTTQLNRVGNLIIGTGVWMSMRSTLREGINRHKNALDDSPTLPKQGPLQQLNMNYFNKITFSIGDAILQVHGFIIILIGSVIGSYGDLIFVLIKKLVD